MLEYALLAACIAIVAIISIAFAGHQANETYYAANDAFESSAAMTGGGSGDDPEDPPWTPVAGSPGAPPSEPGDMPTAASPMTAVAP